MSNIRKGWKRNPFGNSCYGSQDTVVLHGHRLPNIATRFVRVNYSIAKFHKDGMLMCFREKGPHYYVISAHWGELTMKLKSYSMWVGVAHMEMLVSRLLNCEKL